MTGIAPERRPEAGSCGRSTGIFVGFASHHTCTAREILVASRSTPMCV
jgi:hypothetical protein